jgi:hypothetical protein
MKGWRTVVANALAAGLAALNAKFAFIDLSGEEQAAVVVVLLAAINIGLRYVTTTAIGKSA